jgi:hypothetical protein
MRGCVDNCLVCRCPPDSHHYVVSWSGTQQTKPAIPPDTESAYYGVGLLGGLVENSTSTNKNNK